MPSTALLGDIGHSEDYGEWAMAMMRMVGGWMAEEAPLLALEGASRHCNRPQIAREETTVEGGGQQSTEKLAPLPRRE